jgi:hypothetical protein
MEPTQRAQQDKEYSIQHFGFDPSVLVEELTVFSQDTLHVLLEKVKEKILTGGSRSWSGSVKVEELEQGIQELKTFYSQYFDENLEYLGVYLTKNVFTIPRHVLLPEDSVWDGLSIQAAKSKITTVYSETEKMRAKYKSCLYKKAWFRSYLDQLKQVCIFQVETIQKEVGLKEQQGLMEGEETIELLSGKASQLQDSLNTLRGLRRGTKRSAPCPEISREKRQMLDTDFKKSLKAVREAQLSCAQ